MGFNEKCPERGGRPSSHPRLDINRETVVQLYFQSSLSREPRFCDDQLVKLLRPRPPPSCPARLYSPGVRGMILFRLPFSFGIFQNGRRAPEKRQKAGKGGRRKRKIEEREEKSGGAPDGISSLVKLLSRCARR